MRRWFGISTLSVAYRVGSVLLLLTALVCDAWLTHTMALHMLVHIPLILLAGIVGGAALSLTGPPQGRIARQLRTHYGKYNEYGIAGLVLCGFVAAYWMIPKSLDDVLLVPYFSIGKYVGLFLAGVVLFDSLRRANSVIKLFFLGNFSWMMAIVGLIYQEETQRLCNVYLLNDQEVAGRGLVALAVAVPVAWILTERRRIRRLLAK